MKFSICVNQKAAIDSGLKLDIVDLAIFELLKDFSHVESCKTIQEDGKTYYLFHWKLINQQLPILNLNSRHSVYQRMKKLSDAGILIASKDNQANSMSYYRFGPKHEQLIFVNNTGVANTTPGGNKNTPDPVNNNTPNNSINTDNTIKDNIEAATIKKKEDFIKLLIAWVNTHPSKYPKIMYRNFFTYWVEVSATKKKVQLRYEAQEFFDIGRRLSTWFSHCNDQDILAQWNADVKLPELQTILLNVVHGK
jgi:hypothetical protein